MRGEVTRDRNVQGGQPCLRDTRMPTGAIWDYWSQGYDEEGIQEAYPHLTIKQIVTAVLYEERWHRRLERWWNYRRRKWCGCD